MNIRWKVQAGKRTGILLALLLIVSAVLQIPGVTMGRYLTKSEQAVLFYVAPASRLYLLSDRSETGKPLTKLDCWVDAQSGSAAPSGNQGTAGQTAATSPEGAANAATQTGGKSISFCVSNADLGGNGYTDEDISFRIRLLVPDDGKSTVNRGKLNVGLCLGYDGSLYTAPIKATPTYLSMMTARCINDQTPYWSYTFCVGEFEQFFTLQGGQVSNLYIKITLDDKTIDTTGFLLQVEELHGK